MGKNVQNYKTIANVPGFHRTIAVCFKMTEKSEYIQVDWLFFDSKRFGFTGFHRCKLDRDSLLPKVGDWYKIVYALALCLTEYLEEYPAESQLKSIWVDKMEPTKHEILSRSPSEDIIEFAIIGARSYSPCNKFGLARTPSKHFMPYITRHGLVEIPIKALFPNIPEAVYFWCRLERIGTERSNFPPALNFVEMVNQNLMKPFSPVVVEKFEDHMKSSVDQQTNPVGEQRKWAEGDNCMALYPEDDLWYLAKIISIDHTSGTCKVEFAGFEGEFLTVQLKDLLSETHSDFNGVNDNKEGGNDVNEKGLVKEKDNDRNASVVENVQQGPKKPKEASADSLLSMGKRFLEVVVFPMNPTGIRMLMPYLSVIAAQHKVFIYVSGKGNGVVIEGRDQNAVKQAKCAVSRLKLNPMG